MSGANILVVEDEWLVAQEILESLKDLGYAAAGLASSGEEALRLAAENGPDLVVMDILLQGDTDGIEAAEQIRTSLNIPVVFLTAYADPQTLERAKVTEPYGYILKPFDLRELHSAIEVALYKSRAEKRLQHLTDVLRAIRNINQLIVQEKDRDRLIKQACQLMTKGRGYFTAWIALAAAGEKVVSFAVAGAEGDAARLRQLLEEGDMPPCSRRSLKERKLLAIEDLSPSSSCFLWENYQDRGVLVMPLSHQHQVYGVLGVLLPVALCRDEEEISLFQELGNDLALALHKIDLERREQRGLELLKASEEKFRMYFERAPLGYQSLDENGRFIEVNKTWLDILGYSRQEVIGKWFGDFLALEYVERFHHQFPRFKELGESSEVEIKMRHRDGTFLDVMFLGKIARDDQGRFLQTHCVFSDVTERKRGEKELKERARIYHNLFNNTEVAMFRTRLDGSEVLNVNEKFLQLVGRSQEEVIGKPSALLWADPRKREEMVRQLKAEGRVVDLEFQMLRKDGEVRDCLTSLHLYPEEGILEGSILDITERKRLEKEKELTIGLLRLVNNETDFRKLFSQVLRLVQEKSGCEAVGIRLREGEDFPYFETRGFPSEFVEAENRLCAEDQAGELQRDSDGNPVLECMCGNIICGRFNPNLPFFTPGGSFWTNSTTELLASTSEEDRQSRTRNRCNGEGYESVALIPLRSGKENFGLVQFNDRAKGKFTIHDIEFFERLANTLASGLSRRQVEKNLQASEAKFSTAFKYGQAMMTLSKIEDGTYLDVNDMFTTVSGFTREEAVGRTSLELGWITEEDRRHLINNLQRDGLVQDTELKLRTKDGRIVHCLFNGVIVTIHGQQVLLSIAQDITSRKQYEKELQELTHFNKEIITGAGEGIIVYDREFRYKLWNRFMEELTGIHAEEVINRNALEIFPHLRDQKIDELLGSALAGETVTSTDTDFFISKTGRSGWVTGTYTPQRDGQGEIVGVIAIIRDITSQKEAEEVLRESEERFRLLAENAPDAIFITTEKRFAYLNKEATNVLGATNEEQLLGHPLLDRIHPDFRDIVDKRAQSVYEGKTVPRMEQQYLKMDGTPFDAEVSVVPFRYQGENGALVFLRDITARKKTEIAIQEGARLNQLLLDSLPCVTLLLKPLTREIVAANAAAIKVGAVPGKQCFATWAQRQAPCPFCLAPRVWETNQDQHLEIEYGGVYWDAHWVPIKKDLYLHYAFDITQRKEEEKIKQTLEAQIFQAQKMEALGTLAGGIAHDFNNILGSMTGFAELTALDLPETAEGRYYLNYLLKAAERARHLVKQILSFSRQEQTERRPIALTPVVKETLKFLRASLPTTIEIRTHLKAENDMIVADPTQIHQVLLNLATNAAHAMEEKGGVLEISLENVQLSPEENVTYKGGWLPGPFLELRVGDTGHGMEPEVLERIFDPFFTTKDPGKGTGLGLSVVYGIIKDHEGVIQATSTPGKGTTFRVLFPEVQVPLLEVTHEESQQIYKGSGHILFVDDDVDFFQMGKEMLGSLGYRVAAYESSIVALDIFKANPHRFDLIICDQTMPGLTGLELAVACSRLRPDIPIILCTGFSESITPEKVKAAGIDEVVTKPYNLHQISKIIKKVLKKSEPATE